MISYFFILSGILFLFMNVWFIASLIKKRNDVADVAWGMGFVLLAWTSFFLAGYKTNIGLLTSSIVTVWGIRLAWHIHARNKNKPEDARYRAWRNSWGKWFFIRSYFQIYILQGLLLYIISLPVLVINNTSVFEQNFFVVFGLFVWIIGFLFESIGDWQLAHFLKNPKNKGNLMTSGLWAYTRHPNYFGEVTQWWGIWILSLASPFGFFSIVGPLTITFLIVKVSGIPMLEKKMESHPQFLEYKKRVSKFFPFFKKN